MKKLNKKRPERVVIITCGQEPTLVATRDAEGKVKLEQISVPKLDQTKVIDTNGAGDSFVGAFFAALVGDGCLQWAVMVGQELAKENIQRVGVEFD